MGTFFGGAGEFRLIFNWTIGQLHKEYDGIEKNYVMPGMPTNPNSVSSALRVVCFWSCKHHVAGEPWFVDIFGYSRGAILAVDLANRLNFEGCECGDVEDIPVIPIFRIIPVRVRFLGLIDPVNRSVFGLPVKYPYRSPPNVDFGIQHLRSLVGQTKIDAKLFPQVPVPNLEQMVWGPWIRNGQQISATHGNMGNPNARGDVIGLGAAVKRRLKAQAAGVGVRW